MNRIEKDQLGHAGVLLHHRCGERPVRSRSGDRTRAGEDVDGFTPRNKLLLSRTTIRSPAWNSSPHRFTIAGP